MILEKNRKFSFLFVCLFFNKISRKIMSHDHLVRKEAQNTIKNGFYTVAILGFLPEGLTHDFGQKMKILS